MPPGILWSKTRRWQIDKNISTNINIDLLQENYPKIKDAEELEKFILHLSHSYPFLNLEAHLKNDKWFITGEQSNYISKVNIKLVTKRIERSLEQISQVYKGHIHSNESIKSIKNDILKKLNLSGYFKPAIKVTTSEIDTGYLYNIDIDEGKKCEIHEIVTNLRIPDDFNLKISTGDPCNTENIKARINDFEYDLLTSGYKNAKISLKKLELSKDREHANVHISGTIGRRIIFKIEDHENLFYSDSIFNNLELNKKYSTIANPDLITTELRKLYRTRGFDDVVIEAPSKISSKNNTDTYLIRIKPGTQYIVENIRFTGNLYYDLDTLNNVFKFKTFWGAPVILDREKISQNINSLRNLYLKDGFLDIKIHNPRITKNKTTGTAHIVVSIREGKRRVLNKINITGNRYFTDDTIKSLFNRDSKQLLNRTTLLQFEEEIYKLYKQEGFNYVQISIKLNSIKQRRVYPTNLTIQINEGPQVHIGKITVIGLTKTKTEVVTRELHFETGDLYSPQIISASRKSIMNLGIFRSVQISPADRIANLNKSKVIDLNILVSETDSGSITFGPGYNFQKGIRFISELSLNNLSGTGRKFSLRASFSEEKNQQPIKDPDTNKGDSLLGRKVSAGYVEPFILGLPVNGLVSITHMGTADEIWKLSNNINVSLNHKLRYLLKGATINGYYNYKLNNELGSSQQDSTQISTGNSIIGSVGLEYTWDRRNNISWPTSGSILNLHSSWAKYEYGGDTNYFKWDFSFRKFINIKNLVVANSLSLTAFHDIKRKNNLNLGTLPYSERLQAGGVTKVRGFIKDLGPYILIKDDQGNEEKITTGGTHRFILKNELRYKFTNRLASSLFLDCGNSFFTQSELDALKNKYLSQFATNTPEIYDNFSYQFRELLKHPNYLLTKNYFSYGVSMSLISPVGPINAFLSWPLKEPTEEYCENDPTSCFPRSNQKSSWLKRFKFDINIGTEF